VKFLLDVPVGREIAEWLQEQGYDVSEVRTIDPALSDLAILRLARAQSRIVITTDKDFGELAVRQGEAHCGIVRLPDVRATERKAMLNTLIRFPLLREGNRVGRVGSPASRGKPRMGSVPPACRGNLKEGVSTAVFCELWFGDWY
jgi:predicted nuclease of predicted toxin-antitoxin system